MATASNTQFKVENGLLVVGGNANLDVNTTITSTLTATANVVITGNVVGNIVPQAHNTYNLGNTTFRWIVFGSNVVANSVVAVTANLSGNVWITGSPATFNANTGVNNTTDVITTGATHGLTAGDYVFYYTSTGNTVLSGLTNATAYYVASAPTTTTLTLSTTYGGAQVNITASTTSETGHNLIPIEILLSTNGAIHAPGGSGIVNVNTLRVLGGATVNGATTLANVTVSGLSTLAQTTIGGNVAISANVAVDTDLLVLDTVNNLIGLKNAAPLSTDLVTVGGNVVFNASNTTGLRFIATNTSYNTAITLVANSTNSRITFTTWGSTNSSINDGGYLLNLVNSTSTYAGLFINLNKFEYLGGNVAHAGNFGIYDSTGTRVGP